MRTRRWSALFLAGMVLAGCTSGTKTHVDVSTHVEMPGASERDAGGGLPRDVFHVDMVSKDVGWAIAPASVLFTADGGNSWYKISSKSIDPRGAYLDPHGAYLPPSQAWFVSKDGNAVFGFDIYLANRVIAGHRDFYVQIPRSAAKPQAVLSLGFFDSKHGWLIEVPEDQRGKVSEQDVLYFTNNGGILWTARATLPMGMSVTGATFVDAQHGWITGVTSANHRKDITYGVIDRTSDGGKTWQCIAPGFLDTEEA